MWQAPKTSKKKDPRCNRGRKDIVSIEQSPLKINAAASEST
jgi:hypothetical protein